MPEQAPASTDTAPPAAPTADAAEPSALARFAENQNAELDATRRMLSVSQGVFSLSLALCNSPALRDHLVQSLEQSCPNVQRAIVLDTTADLLELVDSVLDGRSASAVFIVGLEWLLSGASQNLTILNRLNASRELWQRRFSFPIVFWLPDFAATLLQTQAPDFWRWFSHQFMFVSEQSGGAEGMRDLSDSRYTWSLQLTADEKRFRVAELEQRLKDAGLHPQSAVAPFVQLWRRELALLYDILGDLDRAQRFATEALRFDETSNDAEGMSADYALLGNLHETRGDLAQAETMFRKAFKINEHLGRLGGMATGYGKLGLVYRMRGDLAQAETMYRKALDIEERLGRLEGMANQYVNLGHVYQSRVDLDQAEAMYGKALEIDERLGRSEGIANQYCGLGNVYLIRGDLAQAEAMYRRSLEIYERLGWLEGMAIQCGNLGLLNESRGDLAGARELWVKARDLYARIGMPHMIDKVQGLIDRLPRSAGADRK